MGQELACLELDPTGSKWSLESRCSLLRFLSCIKTNSGGMLVTDFGGEKI